MYIKVYLIAIFLEATEIMLGNLVILVFQYLRWGGNQGRWYGGNQGRYGGNQGRGNQGRWYGGKKPGWFSAGVSGAGGAFSIGAGGAGAAETRANKRPKKKTKKERSLIEADLSELGGEARGF